MKEGRKPDAVASGSRQRQVSAAMRAHRSDTHTIARRQLTVHRVRLYRRVWAYVSVPGQELHSIERIAQALRISHYQARSSLDILTGMGYIEHRYKVHGRRIVGPFRIVL
jgi:response regulator of citrate/malate metabolism